MRIYKKLKLGIVGHGFVGKATDYGFNKRVSKFVVDPIYNTTIKDLKEFQPEIIFICVPTPMSDDGSQDSKIIEKVIRELNEHCPKSIKVVKSTVLPSILKKLEAIEPNLVYNPEFLREKHAESDFINSDMIIFGGDRNVSSIVSDAYKKHSRCKTKEYLYTDLLTASIIKYSINTFLASKVIFFNELYSVYQNLELNDSWESVINIISKDKRIGKSHMNVPGHDGKKGFGGACFPKDTLALIKYAENIGVDLSLIKSAIKKNNQIRSEYTDLELRETEQNVSFDDRI